MDLERLFLILFVVAVAGPFVGGVSGYLLCIWTLKTFYKFEIDEERGNAVSSQWGRGEDRRAG